MNLVIGRALVKSTGDPIDQARFFVIELFAGVVSLVFTLLCSGERERERERERGSVSFERVLRGEFFLLSPFFFLRFSLVFLSPQKHFKNKKTTSSSVVTRRAFSKPLQLLGTRLIFHTGVWDAVDLAFQHLSRYIVIRSGIYKTPAMSLSVLFVWPSMYRGVYGRFLLSQLDTAGNVAVLNVALAFLGLAGSVAGRPEAGPCWARMYCGPCRGGRRGVGGYGEVRAAKRYMDFLAEITGIVCAASVYTFGVVSREFGVFLVVFGTEKEKKSCFLSLVFLRTRKNKKNPKLFKREKMKSRRHHPLPCQGHLALGPLPGSSRRSSPKGSP